MHGLFYFIGDKGAGKTSFATFWAKQEYLAGKHVVLNYAVKFPHTEMTIDEMAELPDELVDSIVVIDEGLIAANARSVMSKSNNQLIKLVRQLRKMRSKILLVSQKYRDVDLQIREDADFIIMMKPEDRYSDTNRYFYYRVFDQKEITPQNRWGTLIQSGWFDGQGIFGEFDTTTRIHKDRAESLKTKKSK